VARQLLHPLFNNGILVDEALEHLRKGLDSRHPLLITKIPNVLYASTGLQDCLQLF
jgi:hypothetical protein